LSGRFRAALSPNGSGAADCDDAGALLLALTLALTLESPERGRIHWSSPSDAGGFRSIHKI
jgi:hypothetical protein